MVAMEAWLSETGQKRKKTKREKRCDLPLGLKTKDCLCLVSPGQGHALDPVPLSTWLCHNTKAQVLAWPATCCELGASDLPSLNPFAQGMLAMSPSLLCKLSSMIWMWALWVYSLKGKLLVYKVVEKRKKIFEKTQQNCPVGRFQVC